MRSYTLLEYEQTYYPFGEELGGNVFGPKNGIIKVPTRPGLGTEINGEILGRFKVA